MTPPANTRGLRAQLLVALGVLFAAAVLSAAAAVPIARHLFPREASLVAVTAAIITAVITGLGTALMLERRVLEPLRYLTDAARDIAAGNLTRRMPSQRSRDFADLCAHVDRIAHRAAEDQAHVIRAENLASIGRLASSLAHEIGSPLGALRGQLRALRKHSPLEQVPEVAEACEHLDRECARLEQIVRDLLEYARTRPIPATPVALNDVIRDAVRRLGSRHVLSGVHVTIDVPPEPLFVAADRHDLDTVFQNLFENAIEAMRERGRLAVRLERAARFTLREPARRRDGDPAIEHPPSTRAQRWLASNDATEIAKIIVADSGPGVPPQLVDRIFDPYFSTKGGGKGAGLGLAVVARIVESVRGTVWVTRSREGGAAFHILFPVASTPASLAARKRSTLQHRAVEPA